MKKNLILFYLIITGLSFGQQTDYVDFEVADASLVIHPDSSKITGLVRYKFKILKAVDSVFIDAIAMRFVDVSLNSKPIEHKNNSKQLWLFADFKKDSTYEASFNYVAYPKKALYVLKRNDDWQIWTQGQGKYTSNWLPSFDDTNEKVIFNIATTFIKNYEIIGNGKKQMLQPDTITNTASYTMKKPMASYLVALVIGKYALKTETSKSGIPLHMYYYPEDSTKVEPTYRYTKQMFDYLETEIDVPYPWQNYKQVPVHDFLYAGMENTSLTIFSDAFMVNSIGFNDKNYINVNAHELAHQWFGNLVTATSGEHHWLQEGFATYYALLAERAIFGDNYYHFKLYQSAQDIGRQTIAGNATSLLNPKSSSLTFYQRGAWVLHALRLKVGDTVFKQAVKNYLEKHQFANVNTNDFITEVELLAEQNLSEFVAKWIVQKEFPFDEAIELLKQHSVYINEYIMVDCEAKTSKCIDYLKYDVSDDAKVKVIAQATALVTKNTFKSSIKVRQAIAQYVTKIPINLKPDYETLLNDASYITIESALYNLWINFPEERSKYLSKTEHIMGFSDYNVKLLWLVLHLNTPEFQSDKKQAILNELIGYTDKKYNADLRIGAFKYLDLIKSCTITCKNNLENAITHHSWRMVKFAKAMLKP